MVLLFQVLFIDQKARPLCSPPPCLEDGLSWPLKVSDPCLPFYLSFFLRDPFTSRALSPRPALNFFYGLFPLPPCDPCRENEPSNLRPPPAHFGCSFFVFPGPPNFPILNFCLYFFFSVDMYSPSHQNPPVSQFGFAFTALFDFFSSSVPLNPPRRVFFHGQ